MSNAVLYHGSCPDGFGAAWVARRALGEANCSFHAVGHSQPPPNLGDPDSVSKIYVLDFVYPVDVLEGMAEEYDAEVVVLDHHETAIGLLAFGADENTKLTEIHGEGVYAMLDMRRSGAGMTWDYFFKDQPRPEMINYIEDRDLHRFELWGTKEINAFLRTFKYDFKVWDHIDSDWDSDRYLTAGEGALRHIEAYCRVASEMAFLAEIGGVTLPLVNVIYESVTDVMQFMLKDWDADMVGYFFHHPSGFWQYGFHTRNGVNAREFAEQFDGGGHSYAAGARSPELLHEPL